MPKEKSLTTIFLTGDVMLGRLVDEYVLQDESLDPSYVWGNALPLFQKADLRLINLECVITKSGEKWMKTPKVFHFRANPRAIDVLKIAQIDFVSLANNHILDYGKEALFECLQLLDQAQIKHAGTDQNQAGPFLKGNRLFLGWIKVV